MHRRFVIIIGLLFFIGIELQAQSSQTIFENPLAYRGEDSNIYITDGTATVAITDDAFISEEHGESLLYHTPTWSNDGQTLAFLGNYSTIGDVIFIRKSGDLPRSISFDHNVEIAIDELAISPDGTHVAFIGIDSENQGLFSVNLETGIVRHLLWTILRGVGGPAFQDNALHIANRMRGINPLFEQRLLAWNENGIIHADTYGMTLISADGDIIWESEALNTFLLSPDGAYAVSESIIDDTWVNIDVTTGETSSLDIPEGAKPLGWIGEQLYYRTQSETVSVIGESSILEGSLVYDYLWGEVPVSSSRNTIFAFMPDTDDLPIADFHAYDIGLVSGVESTTMLVRYVTSNVPAVVMLNEGASADSVIGLTAHEVNVILRIAQKEAGINAYIQSEIDGTQAVMGTGTFIVAE